MPFKALLLVVLAFLLEATAQEGEGRVWKRYGRAQDNLFGTRRARRDFDGVYAVKMEKFPWAVQCCSNDCVYSCPGPRINMTCCGCVGCGCC